MNKLKSLDVMRGLTVALMILVNNGGEHLRPLLHAAMGIWMYHRKIFIKL